ncbi:MAG TPA: hypothetical protein VNS32_19130 [Flavisolibacter sp.]|nr:hypothetical protein [Flavisolibacter sp.]
MPLIREKDKILFNSICDPENQPSVASWGMNKLSRKSFGKYLHKAVSGGAFVE